MKKYALISLVFAVSLASNCMEKPSAFIREITRTDNNNRQHTGIHIFTKSILIELTPQAKKRMSLVPKVPFSLDNKVMSELQAINDDIKKTDQKLIAALSTKSIDTLSKTEKIALTEYKAKKEQLLCNLNHKLRFLLLPEEKMQESYNVWDNVTQKMVSQESTLKDQLRDKLTTEDEYNAQLSCLLETFIKSPTWTQFIDEYILLYRNAQKIRKFAESGLAQKENEFDPLLIAMKKRYREIAIAYTVLINNILTDLPDSLLQEETSSNS